MEFPLEPPLHRLRRLQPALRCTSMVLLMLGITLVTIVALVVWLRTPEQLFIHQLNDETTVIQGGESVMTLARYIRRELVSSVLLISAGISGILVARRPESHSCGSHL